MLVMRLMSKSGGGGFGGIGSVGKANAKVYIDVYKRQASSRPAFSQYRPISG